MKRIARNLEILIPVLFVACLALGCPKKEPPGPTPEPTPVATEVPTPPEATCHSPSLPGNPPVCQDVHGNQVTCPDGYENLPVCGS